MRVVKFAAIPLLVLITGTIVLAVVTGTNGRWLFRRFVTISIPKSVQEIRTDKVQVSSFLDRFDGYRERAFVLRFKISREDVSRIVMKQGFKPWGHVSCKGGRVKYETTDQLDEIIHLYDEGQAAPHWYDMEDWQDIEAYILGVDEWGVVTVDVSLLLYSERRGIACFIKWQMTDPDRG